MPFPDELSRWVWEQRYRWHGPGTACDADVDATRARVARAVAAAEPQDGAEWEARFGALLEDWRFLPGGRILADAGTGRTVTLLNCFVMGAIEDSLHGIFRAHELGLKGCTTYRAGTARGQVVGPAGAASAQAGDEVERCCAVT